MRNGRNVIVDVFSLQRCNHNHKKHNNQPKLTFFYIFWLLLGSLYSPKVFLRNRTVCMGEHRQEGGQAEIAIAEVCRHQNWKKVILMGAASSDFFLFVLSPLTAVAFILISTHATEFCHCGNDCTNCTSSYDKIFFFCGNVHCLKNDVVLLIRVESTVK